MGTVRTISIVLSLAMLAPLGGCRSKNNNNGADGGGGNGDGGGGGDDTKIQDIQNDNMPVGTLVTVRGVVVTAIDTYGGRTGSVYVEEPEGGAYSGVQVFLTGTGAASLAVGDLVNVEGAQKDEFALSSDTSGRTLTELDAPQGGTVTVTKVGTGTVPNPEVLIPWDLYNDDAEAEKWEGVLIRFDDVAVTSAPYNATQTDPLLMDMTVTGPYIVESALADIGTPARDDCYASITGIGDYFFDYKLLPRSAADLSTGGTNCLPQEEGDTDCADTMDNDHDGYTDCADISCQDTVPSCTTDTTIVDIQNGTVASGSAVKLTGVVVTGVDKNRKNLWVADAIQAAQYNGIYVFNGFGSSTPDLAAQVTVGAKVNIQGRVSTYKGLHEISNATITVSPPPAGAPTALSGVAYTDLAVEANNAPYEGVLVQSTAALSVTADLGFGKYSVTDGTNTMVIDSEIFGATLTAGDCLSSITGIIHHADDGTGTYVPSIEPSVQGDLVSTTCP